MGTATVEAVLELAIRHVNSGQQDRAFLLCEHAMATHPPHPAVLQLVALLELRRGHALLALQQATASLKLRADHPPTLVLAGEAARAVGDLDEARRLFERLVQVAPEHVDAWFQLSLVRQDLRDASGAADALREVLRLAPARHDAEVNLGILLQEMGRLDAAMSAYGRAYRLCEDSFGRIAHALATPNTGRLWLDLDDLRNALRRAA